MYWLAAVSDDQLRAAGPSAETEAKAVKREELTANLWAVELTPYDGPATPQAAA